MTTRFRDPAAAAVDEADRELLQRDRALSPLSLIFDREALTDVVRSAGPIVAADGVTDTGVLGTGPGGSLPDGPIEVHRLRYKPGRSVHAAVRVGDQALHSAWLVFAGYADGSGGKLAKDVRTAADRGVKIPPEWVGDGWLLAPATVDRRLPTSRLRPVVDHPDRRVLAYNARRRLVSVALGPSGPATVTKVYAPGTRRAARGLAEQLRMRGAPVARMLHEGSGVRTAPWIAGEAARPDRDGDQVVEALQRLHGVGGDVVLRPWRAESVAAQVDLALTSVARVLPDLEPMTGDLAADVRARLTGESHGPQGVVHGDLSPDQIVVAGARTVFVDLDECMIGPPAWDVATWWAAQLASGADRPVPLPGLRPPPAALLAAAIAVRVTEPFQRRRRGWAARIRTMLDTARRCLDSDLG